MFSSSPNIQLENVKNEFCGLDSVVGLIDLVTDEMITYKEKVWILFIPSYIPFFPNLTRLYTADAVWYRHPSGQGTTYKHGYP